MTNKKKFAVIGTSWITNSYVTGAIESGLWELSAVYSRNIETGKSFANKFDCELVYTDIVDFAKNDEFEAVYIASPNVFHYQHSKLMLENGKHVICEKALVSYKSQAEELFGIASRKNLIFMEAIMFMHLPQRKTIENAIGKIGKISMATFDFCQRSSKYDALLRGELPNIFNPSMHTGALMDLGVYCIYPALYYFGEPKYYLSNLNMLGTGVDSTGIIIFVYDDKQVLIKFSKIGQTAGVSDIQGDFGTIKINSISKLTDIEVVYPDSSKETLVGEITKETLMGYESIDFFNFIEGKDLDYYSKCKDLSLKVVSYMENIRQKNNMIF